MLLIWTILPSPVSIAEEADDHSCVDPLVLSVDDILPAVPTAPSAAGGAKAWTTPLSVQHADRTARSHNGKINELLQSPTEPTRLVIVVFIFTVVVVLVVVVFVPGVATRLSHVKKKKRKIARVHGLLRCSRHASRFVVQPNLNVNREFNQTTIGFRILPSTHVTCQVGFVLLLLPPPPSKSVFWKKNADHTDHNDNDHGDDQKRGNSPNHEAAMAGVLVVIGNCPLRKPHHRQ